MSLSFFFLSPFFLCAPPFFSISLLINPLLKQKPLVSMGLVDLSSLFLIVHRNTSFRCTPSRLFFPTFSNPPFAALASHQKLPLWHFLWPFILPLLPPLYSPRNLPIPRVCESTFFPFSFCQLSNLPSPKFPPFRQLFFGIHKLTHAASRILENQPVSIDCWATGTS